MQTVAPDLPIERKSPEPLRSQLRLLIPARENLNQVIDFHNHLLPGLDDGPQTLSESIRAARRAEADGVRTIAATPHLREDHPGVRPDEISSCCAELRTQLADLGLAIEVVVGGEVDLVWAQEASSEELRLVSYGQRGTDLLVETPYGPLPGTFEAFLFEVGVRGFRILLGHPERNPTFQREPARLAALVERGILLQVTGGALTQNRKTSPSGRLARWLLEHGLAHVVASDGHGRAHHRTSLSEALAAAEKMVGEQAEWMVTEAPAAVLAGTPLPTPPRQPKRRRLFAR